MEPAARVARAFPLYGSGRLLLTYAGEGRAGIAPARVRFADGCVPDFANGPSERRGQDSNLHAPKGATLAPWWLTVRRTSPEAETAGVEPARAVRRASFPTRGACPCPTSPGSSSEGSRRCRPSGPEAPPAFKAGPDAGPGRLPWRRAEVLIPMPLFEAPSAFEAAAGSRPRSSPRTFADVRSRPPDLHRHLRGTGSRSCGWTRPAKAGGGSRTRVSALPKRRTAVVRHRRRMGTHGIAPWFHPRQGCGLLLTYVPSGSGDLHAAAPLPQSGGSLSTLEPGTWSPSGACTSTPRRGPRWLDSPACLH